jgi:hypothetical protein
MSIKYNVRKQIDDYLEDRMLSDSRLFKFLLMEDALRWLKHQKLPGEKYLQFKYLQLLEQMFRDNCGPIVRIQKAIIYQRKLAESPRPEDFLYSMHVTIEDAKFMIQQQEEYLKPYIISTYDQVCGATSVVGQRV